MKKLVLEKKIYFVKKPEIDKIIKSRINKYLKAKIIDLICRLNTLSMFKRAVSGHFCNSMSALEMMI